LHVVYNDQQKIQNTKTPKQREKNEKQNKGEGIDPIDFLEAKFLFPGEGLHV
jgi:hypothetical protein